MLIIISITFLIDILIIYLQHNYLIKMLLLKDNLEKIRYVLLINHQILDYEIMKEIYL